MLSCSRYAVAINSKDKTIKLEMGWICDEFAT